MTPSHCFKSSIICGAIGDAMGSAYENLPKAESQVYYLLGAPPEKEKKWQITDDTQLTLATCEAIIADGNLSPETFANQYLKLFKQKKITGIGGSILKSLRDLEAGSHWSQAGREGEYAAGNGAAMRIAPLAFFENATETKIREICSITHKNDEAYVGALCVVVAIRAILKGHWTGTENLLEIIIEQIPDTLTRDRLITINQMGRTATLEDIGRLGNNGYVVNSVPLAIAAASKVQEMGIEMMFEKLIAIGGDTDTNCSMAGQIAGALVGMDGLPVGLMKKLKELGDYQWINDTIDEVIRVRM